MFIVTKSRGRLTPSGVKCIRALPAHGTPDGVHARRVSVTINMELLTEFLAHNVEVPNSRAEITQRNAQRGVRIPASAFLLCGQNVHRRDSQNCRKNGVAFLPLERGSSAIL